MLNSLPLEPHRRALLAQILRYIVTGAVVTMLGVAVYWALAALVHLPTLVANLGAYVVSVAIGYIAHSRFSFRDHGGRDETTVRASRFVAVSLFSLALNSLWVWIATVALPGPIWAPIPAMVFVTPVAVFLLNRKWVFA